MYSFDLQDKKTICVNVSYLLCWYSIRYLAFGVLSSLYNLLDWLFSDTRCLAITFSSICKASLSVLHETILYLAIGVSCLYLSWLLSCMKAKKNSLAFILSSTCKACLNLLCEGEMSAGILYLIVKVWNYICKCDY